VDIKCFYDPRNKCGAQYSGTPPADWKPVVCDWCSEQYWACPSCGAKEDCAPGSCPACHIPPPSPPLSAADQAAVDRFGDTVREAFARQGKRPPVDDDPGNSGASQTGTDDPPAINPPPTPPPDDPTP
jgi:hypothetical protein